MKRISVLLLLVGVALFALGTAYADEGQATESKDVPSLSKMDGKDLFKSQCKSCHGEDSDAGEYTPMDLIVEQWEEFFDEYLGETHGDVLAPASDKKLLEVLDKDMLKKIEKFCVDHAADSEQPMTCG